MDKDPTPVHMVNLHESPPICWTNYRGPVMMRAQEHPTLHIRFQCMAPKGHCSKKRANGNGHKKHVDVEACRNPVVVGKYLLIFMKGTLLTNCYSVLAGHNVHG